MQTFGTFCSLLTIAPKGKPRGPFVLKPAQRMFAQDAVGWDIILKGRQMGFSSLALARDVYIATTQFDRSIVVLVQSDQDNRAVNNFTATIRSYLDDLRRVGVGFTLARDTAGEIVVNDTRSTIRVIPAGASPTSAAKSLRGLRVTDLHTSEMPFWDRAEETLLGALESVPPKHLGSTVLHESTPNGATGPFYEYCSLARSGASDLKFHFYPWFLDPDYAIPGPPLEPANEYERYIVETYKLSSDQLRFWRQKLEEKLGNLDAMLQEYPFDPDTCFLKSGRGFFDTERVRSMIASAVLPIHKDGDLRVWQWARPGYRYVIGADTAEGKLAGEKSRRNADSSVAVVYELGTGKHVATLRCQLVPWDFARELQKLSHTFNNATVAVERNNHGHAVIQALQQRFRCPLYYHHDGKAGWLTSEASRAPMLDGLDASMRREVWRSNDRELLSELGDFVINDRGKPEAAKGKHDDMVMAAAIGWAVATRPRQRRVLSNLGSY